MSDSKREIKVRNKSPVGRRFWTMYNNHVDIEPGEQAIVEVKKDINVTSITNYKDLREEPGVDPGAYLIYDDRIFQIEETTEPPKVQEKKIKRLEK